jgi:polyhydroxyalkanoate synthesis regulator phasin
MKEKTRMMVVVAFLAGLLALGMVPALAQDKPADNMQILREKIGADKKLLVATNMELTESEAKAFWPVYEKYQQELFLLRSRTLKLIDDYAAAYGKMNNEIAKKLLDEFMRIDALGPKLRQAYLPKFRKVLPEVKVVRYYQIENKINAALMYELAAKIPLIKTAQ